ncbi:hypothetical protein [Ruegeria atlantica]|uniref:hypothetical protein n=1 Tax=Ruegeria atlantica TaxID=81569 RepID=UPI00249409B5|nr:hypothetical protein [Ruegeria atlantica]
MAFIKELAKIAFAVSTVFVSFSTEGKSQVQEIDAVAPATINESFDGEDQSLMLGGQIFLNPTKSQWVIYVSDGDLVLENRKNPQSLHYNDIAWAKFPDAESVEATQNLLISAVVESQNDAHGGAGILVGSGKSGLYLAFTVDGQGRFHVLKKDGRQLRTVHSAKHEAIKTDGPNQLSFQVRGAHVLFFANGTKVIQVPFSKRAASSRNSDGGTGIGLAAFGTGTFRFEEVEISRPN